jgi:hypothetical protein
VGNHDDQRHWHWHQLSPFNLELLPGMVHRPSDSRLLSSLLSEEKDYSKLLTILNSSLAARLLLAESVDGTNQ